MTRLTASRKMNRGYNTLQIVSCQYMTYMTRLKVLLNLHCSACGYTEMVTLPLPPSALAGGETQSAAAMTLGQY